MQQILAEDFQDASALIEGLVQKAAGVSLWIVLVVASLVSGLRNGDYLSYLQLRLASLHQTSRNYLEICSKALIRCIGKKPRRCFRFFVRVTIFYQFQS